MQKKNFFELREEMLAGFEEYLAQRENAEATIRKYVSDIRAFFRFAGHEKITEKEKLIEYKQWLSEHYAVSSANSMIAALNQFLLCFGAGEWKLKQFRVQTQCFRSEEKEMTKKDYHSLKSAARRMGKYRLEMLIETIAGTGIRMSELKYFTAETVRRGRIRVNNKGKQRVILIPEKLRDRLLRYMRKTHITRGIIFRTKSGKPQDRSNIWKELKQLARLAGVDAKRVFPHNLRHLFARVFYGITRDIIGLADLLGHSNIAVTRLYARNGMEYYQKQINRLGI